MGALYEQYPQLILFLHVISAVVWVGGMIAMRFAAHHSFMELREPPARVERTVHALKRLFAIVAPFIVILLVTALIMAIGMGLHHGENKTLAFAKEGIWSVMALNYLAMVIRRNGVQKLIDEGNLIEAKAKLAVIGSFMVPLNILLGIVAIYLGATLRY
ncbi:MAG: hypothetical protein U9Q62_05770 [Campylobacterota bacterium]|nr:hypothetical protein [Campylobacterota bacterium]